LTSKERPPRLPPIPPVGVATSARGRALFELFIKIAKDELAPIDGKPKAGDTRGPSRRLVAGVPGVHA
jgi:hypothetical protein